MTYLMRRLATFPLVLLGVSILVFVAIRMVPGDAITAMLGTEAGLLTPQQRQSLAAYFGIDQPWLVQYWRWLLGVFQGNLGISVTYGRPVLDVILERFPLTLELALMSMIIALAVGVPAGIFAATRNERPSDLGVRVIAMIGQSTPSFVLGLLIIYTLSAGFGVLPAMGAFVPLWQDPLRNLGQLILPALTLGFAFAVIVEQVFALPGLGRMVLDAILQRDYALVQGCVLFIAFNFMIINLLVDLAYVLLDPRIRLGEQ